VAVITVAVLTLYALLQVAVARSVTTTTWWQTEWVRLQVRVVHPRAPYAQQLPVPGWQAWVPSVITAVLMVGALTALALLTSSAGRGWWLLLVAALPLVPVQLAPGTWAPPLANEVAYALVWPAGATEPSTAWAWVSAAVAAFAVAVPAVALRGLVLHRHPRVHGAIVERRMRPLAVAVAVVLVWNVHADRVPDWSQVGWDAIVALVAAAVVTGALPARRTLPLLLVLPPLAAGALRWTTGPDGTPVVTFDRQLLQLSLVAAAGVLWVTAQPQLARAVGGGIRGWLDMVRADVAARNAAELARQRAVLDRDRAAVDVREDGDLVDVSPRRSRAAPARAGGRHRG
jgi:hypothetical protein